MNKARLRSLHIQRVREAQTRIPNRTADDSQRSQPTHQRATLCEYNTHQMDLDGRATLGTGVPLVLGAQYPLSHSEHCFFLSRYVELLLL